MKRTRQILALVAAGWMMAACTMWHEPSYNLPPRASLTPGREVTVTKSQNVYAVARKYNVSMRDLIVLNDLQPPFILKPGQKLVLPGQPGAEENMENTMAAAPLAPVEGAPVNNAAVTSEILPPPVTSVPSPQALTTPAPVQTMPTTAAPAHSNIQTNMQTATIVPEAKPSEPVPAANVPTIDMSWPLQGPILSSFGPKGHGLNNDGINIGAPKGAPVVAAAGGIVVYAGNEMKGFGNLILIRHEDGWVTAYAHLGRMLVNKDTVVARGDMIGTVGSTGNVSVPQLHFETRYEGKPINPRSVIRG